MTTRDVASIFAGGEWMRPSKGARIRIADPATGEAYGSVPRGEAADARTAIHAARWAFDDGEWPRMTPSHRAALLNRLAVELTLDRASLVELAIHECGATRRTAEGLLVGKALDAISWYAARAARDPETRLPDADGTPPASSLLVREPAGVVGIIAAGAEPLACIAHKAVAALAAGNTIVLKAPSSAPLTSYAFAEACVRAGMPQGSVNVVSGPGRSAGDEIVTNPLVDVVAVAGTQATARRVAQRAAATLKTCVATAGSGGAAMILDGADVDAAAPQIVAAWLAHAGQAWGAACRVVVAAPLHDAVVDALTRAAKGLIVGNPADEATDVGPVHGPERLARLHGLIADAVASGGQVATGGGTPEHLTAGSFLEPAVLINVESGARVAREEVSGPVIAVFSVAGDDEAIERVNAGGDGIAVHVWGAGRDHALSVARRVRAGTVIAQGAGDNAWAPAGGYGRGGIGRERGLAGIDAFSEIKHIATPPT